MCRAVPGTFPGTASGWWRASSSVIRLAVIKIGLGQIEGELSLGEIDLRHISFSEGHQQRFRNTLAADLEQVAGAEIRHRDHCPEGLARRTERRQPDEVMHIDLIIFRLRQLRTAEEKLDPFQGFG